MIEDIHPFPPTHLSTMRVWRPSIKKALPRPYFAVEGHLPLASLTPTYPIHSPDRAYHHKVPLLAGHSSSPPLRQPPQNLYTMARRHLRRPSSGAVPVEEAMPNFAFAFEYGPSSGSIKVSSLCARTVLTEFSYGHQPRSLERLKHLLIYTTTTSPSSC